MSYISAVRGHLSRVRGLRGSVALRCTQWAHLETTCTRLTYYSINDVNVYYCVPLSRVNAIQYGRTDSRSTIERTRNGRSPQSNQRLVCKDMGQLRPFRSPRLGPIEGGPFPECSNYGYSYSLPITILSEWHSVSYQSASDAYSPEHSASADSAALGSFTSWKDLPASYNETQSLNVRLS